MKLSKSGLKPVRIKEIDINYPAQDILLQSGQLSQFESGIYGYNNIPLKVQQEIEQIIRQELEKSDCIEIQLPILQPRNIWEESGRWCKYVEDGTMFSIKNQKGEYGLAPTAEEAVSEFARKQIDSYKRLPVIYYQIGEKFRNELRTRGALLRGKAFPMMDAYSFNKSEEDLKESYNIIKGAYLRIFKKLGLDVIPVVADNGAIGGKKSEEFMVLSEIGEDTILVDKENNKGFNKEILEKPNYKKYLKSEYGISDSTQLETKKAIELGHIFQLGTKYTEPMKVKYIDNEGKEQLCYMGCYGIGVSRTLATIYERSLVRDEKGQVGIVLPINISPYLIQIIGKGDKKEKYAETLYEILKDKDVPTILDDRKSISIGSKIRDCKILGTPYIAVLGEKTLDNEVEIENSLTGEKRVLNIQKLMSSLIKLNNERKNNINARLEDYIDISDKEKCDLSDEDLEQ